MTSEQEEWQLRASIALDAAIAGGHLITYAELADAAATALMAAGPERFVELTAALGVARALLVTPNGEQMATAAMQARLDAAEREHNQLCEL